LEVDDLKAVDINTLLEQLKHDTLLERFAYRKNATGGGNKEFIKLKGTQG
jgi:acyl-CoA-binding protein